MQRAGGTKLYSQSKDHLWIVPTRQKGHPHVHRQDSEFARRAESKKPSEGALRSFQTSGIREASQAIRAPKATTSRRKADR
jgi:hypothetical protein